jgi:general secretion pathway protein G
VIGILLVLGTVSVVAYTGIKKTSDRNTAQILVNQVEDAVKRYEMVTGNPPTDQEGLGALTTVPDDATVAAKWKEGAPYLKDGKLPKDPWGSELIYKRVQDESSQASDRTFRVYSCGPNKEDDNGTGDDVPNWAEAK